MYLIVDSVIEINTIIPGSNNINLRRVIVKPRRINKMCMGKDLTENKLYQIMDQKEKLRRHQSVIQYFKQNTSVS